MADNFQAGEVDADSATPPIAERQGASYTISCAQPGRGSHVQQVVRQLVPSVHYRNGNQEVVAPSITLTPLGAMMPGPAIAPPQIAGVQGAMAIPESRGEWGAGIQDGYPEGCPVPVR